MSNILQFGHDNEHCFWTGMMEFEGQNNAFGGTKRYNNIPLVPPNSCGPPPMGAVGPDFKDFKDLRI